MRRDWARSGRSCRDTCLFWETRWAVEDGEAALVAFCTGVNVVFVRDGVGFRFASDVAIEQW